MIRRSATSVASVIMMVFGLSTPIRAENKFLQHNLVSDLPGMADVVDPNLVNPWGISSSPTSPFWISNNQSGTAKVYDSSGKAASLVVRLHAPGGTNPSTPTGQVFNSTGSFVIPGGKPAAFLFATEDGTISGWYSGIDNNDAVTVVNNAGAAYKGLAIGTADSGPVLYAADFHGGSVDVFGGDFGRKTLAGNFTDPNIPSGFAPFNVYVSGSRVYVAYAKQDDDKHDDVAGNGNGFIDVFDANGHLLQRLVSGGHLDSPWGMVTAPDGFGDFGNSLLVGNFGDGTINAYDLTTGAYLGTLQDVNGKPVVNSGLWGLQFGNGASGGDSNALYFTAGISGPSGDAIESHGLFGSLQAAPAIQANGIVNGAGFQTTIAPNSWITIFGKNLAATTRSWADSDFVNNRLPLQLDGVTATIDGKPAYVAYVSPKQLNVLSPADVTASGPVKVQLNNGGLSSGAAMTDLQPTAPAFFKGDKYLVATHTDGKSLITATAPARTGEVVVLYGTGFGATNPVVPEGQVISSPLPLAAPASILIGGVQADVTFVGLVSPGLYQVNVTIPAGVVSGDAPVVAQAGGNRSPDGMLIAVQAAQPQVDPPPGTYSAQIDNFQFMPAETDVPKGAELKWTNKQGVEHTVVSNDGKFQSRVLAENEAFSFTFNTPGTYTYHCSIHPFMHGTVVVK